MRGETSEVGGTGRRPRILDGSTKIGVGGTRPLRMSDLFIEGSSNELITGNSESVIELSVEEVF